MDDPSFEVDEVDTHGQHHDEAWNLVSKGIKRIRYENEDTTIKVNTDIKEDVNKKNFYKTLRIENENTEYKNTENKDTEYKSTQNENTAYHENTEYKNTNTENKNTVHENTEYKNTVYENTKIKYKNTENTKRKREEERIEMEDEIMEMTYSKEGKKKPNKLSKELETEYKKKKNTKEKLDEHRRSTETLPEHVDRRKIWSKSRMDITGKQKKEEQKKLKNKYSPEDLDTITKLALRLQMNGIDTKLLTREEKRSEDKKGTKHSDTAPEENEVINMMNDIEIKSRVKDWEMKQWEEFSLSM